jgi:hypothetical protein
MTNDNIYKLLVMTLFMFLKIVNIHTTGYGF